MNFKNKKSAYTSNWRDTVDIVVVLITAFL